MAKEEARPSSHWGLFFGAVILMATITTLAWDIKLRRGVLQKKLVRGMTIEQVKGVLGLPLETKIAEHKTFFVRKQMLYNNPEQVVELINDRLLRTTSSETYYGPRIVPTVPGQRNSNWEHVPVPER